MRTSPSSSSTMSTSITLESPQSAIGFLVLSVFGRREERRGLLIVRDLEGFRELMVRDLEGFCELMVRDLEGFRELMVRDLEGFREFGGHDFRWHGQGEAEPRAAGEGGVEPDPAAEVVDDLPGHGQADAGAW